MPPIKTFAIFASVLIFSMLTTYPASAATDIIKLGEITCCGPRILPVLIARDEGFLKEENLELDLIRINGGPSVIGAMFIHEDIDFMLDNGGLIPGIEKGVPVNYRLVVGPWPARIVARPGLKLDDIKNKTVLTQLVQGHGQLQVLKALLTKMGLGPVQFITVSDTAVLIELLSNPKNKEVYDFGFLTNKLIDAEEAGLTTLLDYFYMKNAKIYNYIVERRGVNAQIADRFYKAFRKAIEFINNPKNKAKVIDYMAKYTEKDIGTAAKVYDAVQLKVTPSRNAPVSDKEFIEFAKFFDVNIPDSEIRKFYDPK